MKSLVFFSRLRLADLYGSIHEHLSIDYRIIHLAYSSVEAEKLQNIYKIKNVIIFQDLIKSVYNDFVYNPEFNDIIDKEIVTISSGRFNLNHAIQNDRTFEILDYHDSLLLCQLYYKFWNDFIRANNVEFLFHEPPSLFLNHIASILCEKYGATYVNMNIAQGLDENNWIVYENDSANAFEVNYWMKHFEIKDEDIINAEEFITHFCKIKTNWLPQLNTSRSKSKVIFVIKHIKQLIFNSFKRPKKRGGILDHVNNYQLSNSFKSNIYSFTNRWLILTKLKYDDFNANYNYYYYPMHLEPEAVVLYYGDGIYKDQIKLIENIACSLPSNAYLFVKEHPHSKYVRNYSEYAKLQSIPNVKLLNPSINGRSVIEKSKGIITINGSSGFEGLLFGKKVYAFGNIFYTYSPNCYYVKNIRDLRKILYETLDSSFKADDFRKFLAVYLKSIHNGFTLFYTNKPELSNINIADNGLFVAKGINKYVDLKKVP